MVDVHVLENTTVPSERSKLRNPSNFSSYACFPFQITGLFLLHNASFHGFDSLTIGLRRRRQDGLCCRVEGATCPAVMA